MLCAFVAGNNWLIFITLLETVKNREHFSSGIIILPNYKAHSITNSEMAQNTNNSQKKEEINSSNNNNSKLLHELQAEVCIQYIYISAHTHIIVKMVVI